MLIADVVLVEAVWTLAGRKYRLGKAELVAVLERLFGERSVRFEDDRVGVARLAGPTRAPGRRRAPGFADSLIVFKALQAASDDGEALTGVYTFDRSMQRLPHTAPL